MSGVWLEERSNICKRKWMLSDI